MESEEGDHVNTTSATSADPAAERAEAGTAEPGRRAWLRWALPLAIVLAITGLAIALSGRGTNEDKDDSFSADPSPSTLVTEYGCGVRDYDAVDGIDATEVYPPYCTEVHAISEYCSWPVEGTLVPPEVPSGSTQQRYTHEDVMGTAVIDITSTEVVLTCYGLGGGPVPHEFSLGEWNRLSDPTGR